MAFTPRHAGPSEEQLDLLFHALSDRTRRDILRRCFTQEPSVSLLATSYPISLTAIQKHVRVLEDAGLVSRTRSGREQRVSTRHDGIEEARQALDHLEKDWRGRVERMSALLQDYRVTSEQDDSATGVNDDCHER
ncbi:MAG TPA: helix-turn-helix domain-containing protein [Thermomicrobiales bacterium]|nr:helix-turn-helix domain-containing protein [Thermomicrobiales bacterium]